MTTRNALRRAGATLLALCLGVLVLAAPTRAQDHTFGIEVNGTLCGYADLRVSSEKIDGTEFEVITETVFVMMSVLGNELNTEIESTYHVDPAVGQFTRHRMHIRQGDTEVEVRVSIDANQALFYDSLSGKEETVELTDDVILDNPLRSPHLVRDLVDRGLETATYPVLEVREGEIQDVRYTRVDREELELAGRVIDTVVVDRLNLVNGLTLRQWLDADSGMVVKMDIPGGRSVYLADASVRKRIELANLDPSILQKVDVAISDLQAVEFMKVRAVLQPTGLRLSADDLTVPGQSFAGAVTDNTVDGVFTIEHRHYDGAAAPPFPPDLGADAGLAPFLEPEDLIESDDPLMVAHARALTEGATDSWDAAGRLSAWVADNISYAIPGGVGARKTLDVRAGECGAHSLLLAALCRASGIPARVVWGCMYVPNHGGAFGQHAWNEIYMGEAGWVPVDSTAHETDFVDSTHIRVGTYQSLSTAINMQEMEILEHRLTATTAGDAAADDLEAFIGEYAHPSGEDPFVVLVQDGALGVDIPGQLVLVLHEPDERGRRYAKLTNKVYCTFPHDEQGRVTALTIHEIVDMQRRDDPETVPEAVPEDLRPLLGTYRFAAVRADFEVIFADGGLAVRDPNRDEPIGLKATGEPGQWIDEFDKNKVSFVHDPDGAVRALRFDTANRFERVHDSEPRWSAVQQEVAAMLTDMHLAAAEADGKRFLGHYAPDAIVIGTDPDERWTFAEFEAFVTPYLDQGIGWTTRAPEQHIYLAPSGDLAWFDERLNSVNHGEMRGSGVARKIDGRWRIAQYHTALPIPNELFAEVLEKIRPGEVRGLRVQMPPTDDGPAAEVRAVLAELHRAASAADGPAYFGLFAPDAILFGSDPGERFSPEEAREFMAPYFDGEVRRPRTAIEQHVFVAESGDFAWFDERVHNPSYGVVRGTGALVQRDGAWKLVQYNFVLPIPNELFSDIAEQIRQRRR